MPAYCNVIDNYEPPKGVEVIRSNGGHMRAEQKSVNLLRDVIRMFAPSPNDIVVDLFGGTMSTVIAAMLEGRPAYACEPEPVCFSVGEARVHDFQYRRGAAGLVRRLSPEQITLMQSSICARSHAPDVVPHEPETYNTQTQADA
jgi:DNA methylase